MIKLVSQLSALHSMSVWYIFHFMTPFLNLLWIGFVQQCYRSGWNDVNQRLRWKIESWTSSKDSKCKYIAWLDINQSHDFILANHISLYEPIMFLYHVLIINKSSHSQLTQWLYYVDQSCKLTNNMSLS